MSGTTVIIGAGHAGGTAAALLRQHQSDGRIIVLGDEAVPPYQRPPLSKAWLKGDADEESLALRPVEFYVEANIDLRLGARVETLDVEAGRVLVDGQSLAFDQAIIATGARPIQLQIPGADLIGVQTLRTTLDAETLKTRIGPGQRVVVVGGGYIGLEVAASAHALGAQAIVVERAPRLLARSASPQVADFYLTYHRARGVDVRLNAQVVGFEGRDGQVTGVTLADGEVIACDVVVVGVGVLPNIELAKAAGLACGRGVVVDGDARTSTPGVYAIGDCTERPYALYERWLCPESVPSALEQAKQAAAHIAGKPTPAPETPWNWSDQFDLKLQVAGFALDIDQVVVRGDPESGSFAVFHLKQDVLRQVEAINAPPEFMAGKQLIQRQTPVDPARLADPNVSMKAVAG